MAVAKLDQTRSTLPAAAAAVSPCPWAGPMVLFVCFAVSSSLAAAADVTVAGLFPNKALVQIDGGALQTLSVGQRSAEGVLLVSVEGDVATFEVKGKRLAVRLGEARMAASPKANPSAVIYASSGGHFIADGQINGVATRFLVDTGATTVTLPSGLARQLGLDYSRAKRVISITGAGNAPGYGIKLDTVRVGGITLYGVEALVLESDDLPGPLLGMSFLNRVDMKREGDILTLTQRY